jgi:hypothetical protein
VTNETNVTPPKTMNSHHIVRIPQFWYIVRMFENGKSDEEK